LIAECWYMLAVMAPTGPELQPIADAVARLRARPGSGLTESEIHALYPAMRWGYTWQDPPRQLYNGVRI
jgi:hypothetical protein